MGSMIKILAALICGLVLSNDAVAGWASDWFDQKISSGPGSYKSQKRGFYSGGSFTARRRMTNDYLVSVSLPRVKVGCGGIDLFGGAFSFLDSEYLVAKLQRVLQAAPALAFQIAMQEYCKPCVSGLEALESITNQINQMQMNDCQMARGLATSIVHPNQVSDKIRGFLAQGRSLGNDLRKNAQDFSDDISNGFPPDSTQELLEDCPQKFKDVFGDGSVLENITGKVGLTGYTDEMRGLVGDAIVSYDRTAKQYKVQTFSYCLANDDMDPLDFIEGKIQEMDEDGDCSDSTWTSIEDRIKTRMEGIAGKLTPGNTNALTTAETGFIDAAPFPVLNILRDAVASHTSESRIEMMGRPLAAAYAYRMFDDLIRAIRYAAAKSNEIHENSGAALDYDSTRATNPDPEKCKPQIVGKALRHFQELEPRLSDYRDRAQGAYVVRVNELNASIAFAQSQLEARRRHLNKITVSESE